MNQVIRLLRRGASAAPEKAGQAATADGPKVVVPGGEAQADPLLVFATESGLTGGAAQARAEAPPKLEPVPRQKSPSPSQARPTKATLKITWPAWASAGLAVVASVGGLMWTYPRLMPVDAAMPRAARLTIVTDPAGVDVLVDGQPRGTAPVSLSLAPGEHRVTLRQGADERVLPLTLASGAEVTHHLEFRPSTPAPAALGGMSVVTDPPGAQVLVDGRAHGTSPLAMSDLAAGDYRVRVTGPTGSAERTVTVQMGATASVVFSLPRASSPAAGWLTISAPFEVRISEGANVVGTGRSTKIMLPAGRHSLTLANDALQYSADRTIDVVAGQTATVNVSPPTVAVSANARPWADVFVDGTNVGQTPIANLEMTIGAHDVLFRHPQLGDRRQTVTVTQNGPNRIAVDLTRP